MSIIRDATHSKITELAKLRNASTPLHRYLREADSEGIRFLVYEQDNEIRGFAMLFLRQPAQGLPKSHIPFVRGAALSCNGHWNKHDCAHGRTGGRFWPQSDARWG